MNYLLCPPSFLTAHSHNLLPSLCSSVPFVNPVSRTLPPSSRLLPNITIHQSPRFLSITVPPCHRREQFNHLWPNLSFNDVWTLQGPPVPYKRLFLQVVFFTWCVHSRTNSAGWVSVACMNACMCVWKRETDHLLQLVSVFLLFWDLDQFLVLFMRAGWESLEQVSRVPGKTYGAAGIQTPAVEPVRVLSESLGNNPI